MNIRHTGIYVNNIYLVEELLIMLGFYAIYDEIEIINDNSTIVKKIICDKTIVEILQDKRKWPNNSFHISFEGDVPDFLFRYVIVPYKAFDNNLLVDFVYINDTIYFEFVRNKN